MVFYFDLCTSTQCGGCDANTVYPPPRKPRQTPGSSSVQSRPFHHEAQSLVLQRDVATFTLLGTPVHLIIHANSQSVQHKAQCIYATEASSRADLNTQRVLLKLEDDQQQNL